MNLDENGHLKTTEGNFYEVLGIPENATNEQIDEAYERYVSIHGLKNPDDSAGGFALYALGKIKNMLKQPEKRFTYDAMLRAAKYEKDADFKLLCVEKDMLIEVQKKTIEIFQRTLDESNENKKKIESYVEMLESENSKNMNIIAKQQSLIEALQKIADLQQVDLNN